MFRYTPHYTGYQLSVVQSSPTEFVCVCVCVRVPPNAIRCNSNPLHLQWSGRKRSEKERKKEFSVMAFIFMVYDFSGSNCISIFR